MPYRESKLTRLLQESLGGNAKTSLIVTISPSNYNADESFSSLNFGLRAMKVKNLPKINKLKDYQSTCVKLQEEYDKLMEKYAKLKIEYSKACEENEKFKNGEKYLDLQRKSLRDHISDIGSEYEKNNFDLQKIKNEYEYNLKELEQQYQQVINNKEQENNKKMEEIDKELIEKEEEIERLNEEVNKLKEYNNNLIEKNEDLSNEINDLKNIYNDMLIEKDELNNKIILLTNLNKENNYVIDTKTKNLLSYHNINTNIINNKNINLILNKLIGDIGKLTEENNKYRDKINRLNNYLNEVKDNYEQKLKMVEFENNKTINEIKNYEEKIKMIEFENNKILTQYKNNEEKINQLVLENNQFRNMQNNYIEQINNKEEEKNDLKYSINNYNIKTKKLQDEKNALEKNILSLKNTINELDNKNKDIENKYESKIKSLEEKLLYENRKSTTENNNRMININAYLNESELKRLNNTMNMNEKIFNKSINLLLNDMAIFNIFKKEFKKMEIIIDNDIPSITSNSYEHIINKAKNEISKIQNMIENIHTINNNNSIIFKNYNIKDNINKINEIMEENKEYMINFFILLNKLFNKIVDFSQKNYKKINGVIGDKKNLDNLKYEIIDIILKNIDEFKPMCFNRDNSDLKDEAYLLKNNCNKLNIIDVFKNSNKILEKTLARSLNYRKLKELEIQNLNSKIIYFLREIENYKKTFNDNNNKINSKYDKEKLFLLNQNILKDGEIIRLNKEIESLLKKIKNLLITNELDNINNENNNIENNVEKYIENNKVNNIDNNIENKKENNIDNNIINNNDKYLNKEIIDDLKKQTKEELENTLIITQNKINNIKEEINMLEREKQKKFE